MKKTIISGASDDLIDISGELEDEIQSYKGIKTVGCSDGTVAKIHYDGEWRINLINEGELFDKLIRSVGDDGKHADTDCIKVSGYSDALVLKPGIKWIKIGNTQIKRP